MKVKKALHRTWEWAPYVSVAIALVGTGIPLVYLIANHNAGLFLLFLVFYIFFPGRLLAVKLFDRKGLSGEGLLLSFF